MKDIGTRNFTAQKQDYDESSDEEAENVEYFIDPSVHLWKSINFVSKLSTSQSLLNEVEEINGRKKHRLGNKRANGNEMDNGMVELDIDRSVNGISENILPSAFEKGIGILSRTPTMSRSRAASMVGFDETMLGNLLVQTVVSSKKLLSGVSDDNFECTSTLKRESSPRLLVKNVSKLGDDSIPVVGSDSNDVIARYDTRRSSSSRNWDCSNDVNIKLAHLYRSSHAINLNSGTTSADRSARTITSDFSNTYDGDCQKPKEVEVEVRIDNLKKNMLPMEKENVELGVKIREPAEALDVSRCRAKDDVKIDVERRECIFSNPTVIRKSDKNGVYHNETINSIHGNSASTYCIKYDTSSDRNRKYAVHAKDSIVKGKKIDSDISNSISDPDQIFDNNHDNNNNNNNDDNNDDDNNHDNDDNDDNNNHDNDDNSNNDNNNDNDDNNCNNNNDNDNSNSYNDNNDGNSNNDSDKDNHDNDDNSNNNNDNDDNNCNNNDNNDNNNSYYDNNNDNNNDNSNNDDNNYNNNSNHDINSRDANILANENLSNQEKNQAKISFDAVDIKLEIDVKLLNLEKENISAVLNSCLKSVTNKDDLIIKRSDDVEENVTFTFAEGLSCEKLILFIEEKEREKEYFADEYENFPTEAEIKMKVKVQLRSPRNDFQQVKLFNDKTHPATAVSHQIIEEVKDKSLIDSALQEKKNKIRSQISRKKLEIEKKVILLSSTIIKKEKDEIELKLKEKAQQAAFEKFQSSSLGILETEKQQNRLSWNEVQKNIFSEGAEECFGNLANSDMSLERQFFEASDVAENVKQLLFDEDNKYGDMDITEILESKRKREDQIKKEMILKNKLDLKSAVQKMRKERAEERRLEDEKDRRESTSAGSTRNAQQVSL